MAKISTIDALGRLLQALSARTDLISILRLIMNLAVRLSGADRASIFLLDPHRDEVWTLMADGDRVFRLPRGAGIVGEVINSNQSLIVPDTSQDTRFYPNSDRESGYQTRSILCVPLRNRDGAACGAVEVLNKRRGVFTDRDRKVLEILGIQAGLAIESIEMYEDIQESCLRLEMLLNIQKRINLSMETEEIFRIILEDIVSAVKASAAVIHILHPNGTGAYHSYHPVHGVRGWELDDRRGWPGYLEQLKQFLSGIPEDRKGQCIRESSITYTPLCRADRYLGYIAVQLQTDQKRLLNDRPGDYIRVVAEQTVALIEKKRMTEQHNRTEKQALLGTMLSTIMHDMKSPLSGISGFTQLIGRRTEDSRIRDYCTTILQSLSHIEKMSSELLLFVRGQSLTLDRTSLDLGQLLRDAAVIFQERADQEGISLKVVCPVPVIIEADSDRLMRVITNLVQNACEAMTGGGDLMLECDREENMARISIKDTGCGIPGHLRDTMFEPFVTVGKKQGTGLGMCIVKSIVELHRGTITVQSARGRGTTVTICLPIIV